MSSREFVAGGIDQFDRQAVANNAGRQKIARGSGNRRDKRGFATDQGVKEPALAYVRWTVQDDPRSAVDAIARGQSSEQIDYHVL